VKEQTRAQGSKSQVRQTRCTNRERGDAVRQASLPSSVCITQTHKEKHHINKIKIFNIMIQNKLQGAKAQKQGKQETPHRTPLVTLLYVVCTGHIPEALFGPFTSPSHSIHGQPDRNFPPFKLQETGNLMM
jgi:hypothetical protein